MGRFSITQACVFNALYFVERNIWYINIKDIFRSIFFIKDMRQNKFELFYLYLTDTLVLLML